MSDEAQQAEPQRSPIKRIFVNTAWLLGGNGFGAACSLIYLAILTRTLGLKGFGHFSLILGTAQAMVAIAGFQSWRVVVRYGAPHIYASDWNKFGRLAMLCGLFDILGALAGTAFAFALFYGFADILDLNPAYVNIALAFCCASLWALNSAATGILRALDRFDSMVYVESVVPTGRLIAALVVLWAGATVGRFLFAWAAISLLQAILYWITARRLCPQAVRLTHLRNWRQALTDNPGVEHFFLVTYAGSTLDAITRNGPLLAVGGLVGTQAAGLYRLASQLTQAMSKLSTLLARAVYAEVARARVTSAVAEFRKLAAQTSIIAGLAGVIVVAMAIALGGKLLGLIGGEVFERGALILVPLAIAASFELASVAFEPVLHSTGRARYALLGRVMWISALLIALYLLASQGAPGIAWAVAVGGGAGYVAMGLMAMHTLRRIADGDTSPPTSTVEP